MRELVWITALGATGTLARYGIYTWIAQRWSSQVLWGTLFANLIGCLMIGWVAQWEVQARLPPHIAMGLMVGLLGGLTTFSTFGLQTVRLLQSGALSVAALNVALHLFFGLAAVWLGMGVAAWCSTR